MGRENTFREYLVYVAASYGVALPDVAELVKGFHFEDYTNILLKELSTGNLKKAYLITAFALRPRLLLLDEPVNGLDFQSTEFLYQLMGSYKEHGTILFSSHILESICLTSDRVLVLEHGKISRTFTGKEIAAGNIREVLAAYENRGFVFSYAAVLGAHTMITTTLLIWVLFFAATAWSGFEIAVALLCGCMACAVTSAVYLMFKKKNTVFPILWVACILAVILIIRQTVAILAVALISISGAILYLYFSSAYDFYNAALAKKSVRHTGYAGNVFAYLVRYLMANKSYCVNTVGLCAAACFLPLLFGEFQSLNVLPVGLAVLCLNTPICTLLSCDPDLEQAIRVLPGQADRFCRRYCLFIFAVNGVVASICLCSWQFINGGIEIIDIGTAILFALQSAILSVVLEWVRPIRNWKTESDLWHHPQKYLVPLVMLLLAALIGTWTLAVWILFAALLVECCV